MFSYGISDWMSTLRASQWRWRNRAVRLARSYRAGDLTPVWVPDAEHEALRDLVRAREAAKRDDLRARHRLGKFLLRQGRRAPQGVRPWTQRYMASVQRDLHFAALQALRGIARVPAVTIVAELGDVCATEN